MSEHLVRIGTTYLPVSNVERSTNWYVTKLGAKLNYQDESKAILDLANQSFFLVSSQKGESSNFYNSKGEECFSITFEVEGIQALETIRKNFIEKKIMVSEVEDRAHAGKNFVFHDPDGNTFDVWSEVSTKYKERYLVQDFNEKGVTGNE
ncbi:VOC family protein [Pseudalkalibacillus hwajinpoensis]|uniref:VOC family protein n=1 Tax=Guptibacillus hwajinpoensis TaxID=208199 RepID=UPI00325BE537